MNIELHQINKQYGKTHALRDLSLCISDPVNVIVLIGPSGSGKSTLMRLLGALESPDSGELVFDQQPLLQNEEALLQHRRQNGYLFQSFNLFPHLTAAENIELPLIKVHGKKADEANKLCQQALEKFQLEPHQHKYPSQLSGGQQQRFALARAIAIQPRLLLLDEPTSALDPEMTAEVLKVIETLSRSGQPIILSTHEMGFARAVADQVIFLAEGKILEQGSPEELFGKPSHPYVQNFLSKVMRY
ncbi:MAG: amino acid ABC transporter ATP-binding protein [Verrucomicrobiales bacterium]|nr:amino acid ABC transporter ATP-binding protein [Verrucomicrobiales bacterium]